MQKKTRFSAILEGKCPRCRKGDMFKYPAYYLTKFNQMHDDCPACGLTYSRETGFFYGAMYISYALSVVLFLAIGIVLYNFFGDPDTWVYITTVVAAVILLFPILFRHARVLYLHFFGGVRYKPEFLKNK